MTTPTVPTLTHTPPSLSITPQAAAKVKSLLEAQQKSPADHVLRVGVSSGGCSGLSYVFNLGEPQSGDLTFARDGIRVVCDPKSILYLNGSELHYQDSLTGAGFVWQNPNVKGTCGCGTSFNV